MVETTSMLLTAVELFLLLVVIFVVVFVLSFTLYIVYIRNKYSHLPNPPYDSFFFGHIPQFTVYKKQGKYIGYLFQKWYLEYGNVIVVYLLHSCVVFAFDPSSLKVLLTKSKYRKSPATYEKLSHVFGARFLGNGLLNETDHQKWHRRRTAVNPAFHKRYLMMFMEQFNDVGDRWIKSLDKYADGKTVVNMHDSLCRVTLDAISEVGFSDHLNTIESQNDKFLVAILNCLRVLARFFKDPFMRFRPSERGFRQEVRDSIKYIRDYGRQLLDTRLRAMDAGESVPDDIRTYIIKCRETDAKLTFDQLLDDFVIFFLAGQETTSNALSFMFSEVARRPHITSKLETEVDAVLGARTRVDYEDLSRLDYCALVFKETLRLYPVAPGTARLNPDDVVLDGHRIPAQTQLLISFFATQRSPKYYKDPEEFLPERFAPGEPRTLYTYMPFSLGQRSCIGQQFAQIESKVLMSKFFRHYAYTLDESHVFDIEETGTLRPKGGVKMVLTKRRRSSE
jgi:cholesterol 24(S)-hydroxylase